MKTVEPQFGAASFSCPHCGANAQQTWFRLFRVAHERGQKPGLFDYENCTRNLDKIEDEDARARLPGLIERLRDNDVTWMASSQSGLSIEMANLNLSTCFSCKGTAVWVKDRIAYPETKSTIAATEEMPAPGAEGLRGGSVHRGQVTTGCGCASAAVRAEAHAAPGREGQEDRR